MELLNQKRKSREIHPVLFFSAVLCLFYGNLYTRPGYDQSRYYWTMTVRFILLRIRCTFLTFSTDLSPAVAPGPAGAGANSVLLRQSGIAVLPSSAAPPGYAAGIPTSGPRQILAGSPSRYLQGDADAPHQYRRGSDAGGCGTATR